MSRILILLASLLTAGSWSPVSHRTQAATPTSTIVSESLSRWANSKGCIYTASAEGILLEALSANGQQVEPDKIPLAVESYLDWVAVESFGPLRTNCVVSAAQLRERPFDSGTYAGPRKGYLKVDGTKKGAEIYINGNLKGYIDQLFALSPGNYRVKTMKCDVTVKVDPDRRKDFYCTQA